VRYFVAMSHTDLAAYQAELMKDEGYAAFVDLGKTARLDQLGETDDAYYIQFSFSRASVPLFDQWHEQSPMSAGDVVPPVSTYAEILLTGGGIRGFALVGAYADAGNPPEVRPLLGVEEMLAIVAEKYSLQIVTDPFTITRIYLEYLPLYAKDTLQFGTELTLTPYWCFEFSTTFTNDAGLPVTNTAGADRFNAFTGEDYAYGG
jgi:hypothetical protein